MEIKKETFLTVASETIKERVDLLSDKLNEPMTTLLIISELAKMAGTLESKLFNNAEEMN